MSVRTVKYSYTHITHRLSTNSMKGEYIMHYTERREYLQNQLIQFQNNHDLPTTIRNQAQRVDIILNTLRKSDTEVETAYMNLQFALCDFIADHAKQSQQIT